MKVPNPESALEKKVLDLVPDLRLFQPAGEPVHHSAAIAKYPMKSAAEEKTLMSAQCGASSVATELDEADYQVWGARGKGSYSPHSSRSQKTYIERGSSKEQNKSFKGILPLTCFLFSFFFQLDCIP